MYLTEEESQEVYSAKQIIKSQLDSIANSLENDIATKKEYRSSIDNLISVEPDEDYGDYRDKGTPRIHPSIVVDEPDFVVYRMVDSSNMNKMAFRSINERILKRLHHTEEVMSLPALFDLYTDYDEYTGCICCKFKNEG